MIRQGYLITSIFTTLKVIAKWSCNFDNLFETGTRMRAVFFFHTWLLFMFVDAIGECAFCFSKCLTNSSTMFWLTATAKTWAQYISSFKCLQFNISNNRHIWKPYVVVVIRNFWQTKYLRLALVFMWNSAQRKKFSFCFSRVFR